MSKICLASVCALLVVLLAIPVRSAQIANFEKCRQKLAEKTRNFNFNELPKCFNASKLAEAKNSRNVFETLVKSLPKQCSHPNASNVQSCLSSALAYLKTHVQEVRQAISEGITALAEGARTCVDSIQHATRQFSNIDQYIAHGCDAN